MSQLDKYSAQRAIRHLSLGTKDQDLATGILNLMNETGRARIADLQDKLFPYVTDASANNALLKFRKAINQAAEDAELNLKACVTTDKKAGAGNRWLWFEGANPVPKLARTQELDSIPADRLVTDQYARPVGPPTVLLITFNEHETRAVHQEFDRQHEQFTRDGRVFQDLGIYGGTRVVHTVSRQGVVEAQSAAEDCIRLIRPGAVIGVGIAFGVEKGKQEIGDVLFSTAVRDYELRKIDKLGKVEPRGLTPPASDVLVDRLNHLQHSWTPDGTDGNPRLIGGVLLSGNALVDNLDYRDSLRELAGSDIVGGEMEGLGLHKPASKHRTDWVVVKAICDFGDGNKGTGSKEADQKLAARKAAHVVRAALEAGPLYQDGSSPIPPAAPRPPALQPFNHDHPIIRNRGFHTTLDKAAAPTSPRGNSTDVLEELTEWAMDSGAPAAFALLGEYGMGKTVTAQRLAKHLREQREVDPSTPVSFYFDLREITNLKERVPTLDEIVTEVMRRSWPAEDRNSYTYDSFEEWLQEPAVVIFDGLDEVLVKLNQSDGQTFTRTLLGLLPPSGQRPNSPLKMLISCRTQYFRTLREQQNHFTGQERGDVRADAFRAIVLLPFEEDQVITYLEAAFPDDDPHRLLETVRSVHDLEELTHRPYTLSLVTQFLPEIETARAQGKEVYGVSLYRRTARAWLERDEGKHRISAAHKPALASHLAAYLWQHRQSALPGNEIDRWFYEWLDSDRALSRRYQRIDADQLEEDLRTATFLSRIDHASGSTFRFAHTSLQEYFLAEYLLEAIRADKSERWALPTPSPETFDFLGQLLAETADPDLITTLSSWKLSYRELTSENLLTYALRSHSRGWPQPNLRGSDFTGAHLDDLVIPAEHSCFDLSGANFTGASLRRVALHKVDLSATNFTDTVLHQGYFLECALTGAAFDGADLSGASIRRCSDTQLADANTCGLAVHPSTPHAGVPAVQSENAHLYWNSDGMMTAFAVSPDGIIATQGVDGTIQIWDAATGRLINTLNHHTGHILSAVYSPDATTIATVSDDDAIRIWDTRDGQLLTTITENPHWVCSIAFSADGNALAAASANDDTIRIWNPTNGRLVATLSNHNGPVTGVTYSPNGHTLATANYDSTVQIWDPATAEVLAALEHSGPVSAVAYSSCGAALVAGSVDGTVRIWNPTTGQLLTTITAHEAGVKDLIYSPDGTSFATICEGTVRVWDPTTGELLSTVSEPVNSVSYALDGTLLVTTSEDGVIRTWNSATSQLVTTITNYTGLASRIIYSPNGTSVATATDDGSIRIWRSDTAELLTTIKGNEGWIYALSYAPDGNSLVAASTDGIIRIWDTSTGQLLSRIIGHEDWVNALSYAPDGNSLVAASTDGIVRIWDTATNQLLCDITDHTGNALSIAHSPDSSRFAIAGFSSDIEIRDASTGHLLTTLSGHDDTVRAVAYSPDGSTIATADDGGIIRIWDTAAGQLLSTIADHTGVVNSLVYSSATATVTAAGSDGIIWTWNPTTGDLLTTITGHAGAIVDVDYSPDGATLATTSIDGTARIWNAADGSCQLIIGLAYFHPLKLDGYAVWRPEDNTLLALEGEAWRCLYWERERPGQLPELLPVDSYDLSLDQP